MSSENQKIKVLGDFLKSRRERIKPDHVSIVGRFGTRRTPGLRREEVAHLAGVSITWYTWLEQGRAVTASREVIESISKALELTSDEHLHLLRLANYGGDGDSYPNAKEIDPELQNIIDQLNYPAIIANNRTEVLAYNRMASEIIVDFDAIPVEKRVMTHLIFTDPNLRKQLVNWKEFADFTLGVFRMYFDQKAGDLWYEEFVRRMCEESEEFLTLWRLHDVHLKKAIHYTFDHLVAGRLFFQLNTFSNINGNENLHCCVFTPIAGTDTEQKLVHIRK
ncbi:transcriptional regulator with XRE-family HTH domain [Paenibacillus sp. V4I3]|uniref:helix-turn-helix transcriptional regulator n=1 Tax=unclassified Paenibacillus TaxID=185978 RepID=UPI0027832661|nr:MULTISPECIES: helix-turn-helix transcriptional regulator [unclassified Paenibacillus]MDQ0875764.1 transcriptional regulator with XRE-family HTH domain [Paenibacillus sp. V4I3]MDQ0888165.1 transcriptional regulator with XRE-family HTH domain [Paenibacillus sp. V4I9]